VDPADIIAGATALRATTKALLVRFADGYQRWIPLSQLHPTSAVKCGGDCGTLIVSTWLAGTIADERAAGAQRDRSSGRGR
jgi:hypothetical protein